MNPRTIPQSNSVLCIDAVAQWLLHDARGLPGTREVVGSLCERLIADGFPLYRMFVTTQTLHPEVAAIGSQWRRGDAQATEMPRGHGILREDIYLQSPIKLIHDGAPEVRWRADQPVPPASFPVVGELRAEGVTDYLMLPLRFGQGRVNAISVATDHPGGFSDAQVARFRDLVLLLAPVLEVKETQRVAATLLGTYLGRDAGRRVLGGLIRRGDGVTIAAALWYCDLRGFTTLSEQLPRDAVITLLNDYFECIAAPVHHHGGEVLKFIGDAMLAIFPMDNDLDRDRACLAALAAAEEALAELAALNEVRRGDGKAPLTVGIALHSGPVMYGNIGAPDRLDFTVIGPAVNLVTRLERLCSELGQSLLASARFASYCGSKLISLGRHPLRGIAAEEELFALPTAVAAQAGAARRTAS
ncbi:MAG: adenylate/guanylate cyclase domain-containing protein [Dongiaceae bacterium]